jgi:hypothetical protein
VSFILKSIFLRKFGIVNLLKILPIMNNVEDERCNLAILILPYSLKNGLPKKIYGNPNLFRGHETDPVKKPLSNPPKMTIIHLLLFFPRKPCLPLKNPRYFRLTINFCLRYHNASPYTATTISIIILSTLIRLFHIFNPVLKVRSVRRPRFDYFNNTILI